MAAAPAHQGTNWLIRFAAAVLLIVLGFLIVKTAIIFTNPESAWKQPAIAPGTSPNTVMRSAQNFSFATDPFNRSVTAVPEAIAEVGEDAPETTLNLKLTGRTTGPNGTAILRTPDNKEGTYRIGDEIVSGVILQAVNLEFIVLNVDGQIQRLTFERGNDTGLMKKTAAVENTAKTTLAVKVPSGNNSASLPSTEVSRDVSQIFQNLSLRRVMKNGQLTGYSVKGNRPGVDLTLFGLSKGDIVTTIGGTDITRGRPDFLALFESAAQNGGTDITVLRNGQIKTIKLGTP